ncbi:Na/Pi cotransporter family protein [Magnetococcales bacterium HHB-1]
MNASVEHSPLKRLFLMALLLIPLILLSTAGSADAAGKDSGIDFFMLTMRLFGGLAIFLYGMEKMSQSLKVVAGDRMKEILGKLTSNRLMGLTTGAFVTAVIQSSSVTTVLLVGFVSAELMTLAQAIGVIFGANIGTTITAQIIAFKVTKYAALMIAVGFALTMIGKEEKTRHYGHMLLGLGLIFFGMSEMSSTMKPLRSYEPFLEMMQNVSNPLTGIMVAAAFTGLVQSSSATTGVILALAMQGLISLEGGIALILGANIGTCITAALAAIGKPREAVRVAIAHVTFNIVGALLLVGFIPAFADLCRSLSPIHPELAGMDRLAAEVPRQIANAHSLFNVGAAFLLLPLTGVLAKFCIKVAPDPAHPEQEAAFETTKHLDTGLIKTPSLALSMARREIGHMADCVESMIAILPEAVLQGDMEKISQLEQTDDQVDAYYQNISRFLYEVAHSNISPRLEADSRASFHVINELEIIGDVIKNNFANLTLSINRGLLTLPKEDQEELVHYHELVLKAYKAAAMSFSTNSVDNARAAMHILSREVPRLDRAYELRKEKHLVQGEASDFAALFAHENDFRSNMNRMLYHINRIAKITLKEIEQTA